MIVLTNPRPCIPVYCQARWKPMLVVLSVKISIYGLFYSDIHKIRLKRFVLPGLVTGALKGFTVLKKSVNVVL